VIIAIDFDGTLVEDRFPEIGEPIWPVVDAVWRLGFTDHELILWTSRVDKRLEEAVQWCKEHDLKFTSINAGTPGNISQYGTDPRKVFADVYIDDRAVGYTKAKAVNFLNKLFTEDKAHGKR
jgi:hypothetical protein